MAGSLTTVTTIRLMTLAPMISVVLVGGLTSLILDPFYSMVLTYMTIVPKFQGENFYKNKAIVEEIKKLAVRRGCTTAQIALAWVAAQGMIAIPGTTKVARLEENWGSRGIELTEEELVEMRKIVDSAKPVGNRYSEALQATVGH